MGNPIENAERVAALVEQVKEHPLCLTFEDDGYYYRVIYPRGEALDGVQASQGAGKAVALERMLDAMERHWREALFQPVEQ